MPMQKCDHGPCTCEADPKDMVARGKQRFCSEECATAQDTFGLTCHCPHANCGGRVAAQSA